jgi:hypothetical protein
MLAPFSRIHTVTPQNSFRFDDRNLLRRKPLLASWAQTGRQLAVFSTGTHPQSISDRKFLQDAQHMLDESVRADCGREDPLTRSGQPLVFDDEEPAATGLEAEEFQATRQSARRLSFLGGLRCRFYGSTPFLTTLGRRFSMLGTRGPVAPLLRCVLKEGGRP